MATQVDFSDLGQVRVTMQKGPWGVSFVGLFVNVSVFVECF